MGFKSSTYRLSGLEFKCKKDYLIFRDLDKNINETVRLVNNGSIKLEDVFKDVKPITVTELYYNSRDEMDGTFINATSLLVYEDTPYHELYIIGVKFFEKINVIKYDDSDSDSD